MKIGWFSRNTPLPDQIKKLEQIFNEKVILIRFSDMFRDGNEIAKTAEKHELTHAVIVAPLSMIQHVIKSNDINDITWLWAQMNPVHDECIGKNCEQFNPASDVINRIHHSRYYRHQRFSGFKKIVDVKIILVDFNKTTT